MKNDQSFRTRILSRVLVVEFFFLQSPRAMGQGTYKNEFQGNANQMVRLKGSALRTLSSFSYN